MMYFNKHQQIIPNRSGKKIAEGHQAIICAPTTKGWCYMHNRARDEENILGNIEEVPDEK